MPTRARDRVRAALADADAGFTLVETVVALFLVTIALGALAATIIATNVASHGSELRSRADQYAAQCLEQAMSASWGSLVPGSGTCSVPSPFSATTSVGWMDAGASYDYKHVAVTVSWSTGGVSRSTSVDGLRAPTLAEETPPSHTSPIVPALSLSGTGVTPASDTLQANGTLVQNITLVATTSRTATSVVVSFPTTTGTKTASMTGDASGTSWSLTIQASGPYNFNPGTEQWNITANGNNSAPANATISNTLNPYTASSTTLSAGNPAPASQQLDSSNYLTSPITFQASTTAPVSTVVVTWTDGSNIARSLNLSSADGGSTWSGTLAAGAGSGAFASGTQSFTFTATAPGQTIASITRSVGLSAPLAQISIDTVSLLGAPNGGNEVCVAQGNQGNGKNQPWNAQQLQFTVHNPGTSPTVTVTWSNQTATSPTVSLVSTAADGSQVYVASIPTTAVFNNNSSLFTMTVHRSDGANNNATYLGTVASVNKSSSC